MLLCGRDKDKERKVIGKDNTEWREPSQERKKSWEWVDIFRAF